MSEEPPRGTILIVDDGPQNRKLLSSMVRMEKYAVLEAANGIEALELIDSECIDLIFLDLMMPEESGFGVLQGMEERGLLPLLPVIVVTSHDLRTLRLEALRRGVVDYMTKPIDRLELIARMKNILEARQKQQAHARTLALKLGGALELLSEGVVQLDGRGMVLHANKVADVPTGQPLRDAFVESDRGTVDQALVASTNTREPVPFRVTRSNDETQWVARFLQVAPNHVVCIMAPQP